MNKYNDMEANRCKIFKNFGFSTFYPKPRGLKQATLGIVWIDNYLVHIYHILEYLMYYHR
jgi:hypothetical protein